MNTIFEIITSSKPFSNVSIRGLGKKTYNWKNEGIQYPGFKYYPRSSDFEEPTCVPAKLFRIQRIKPIKGTPYWERNILKEFKLDSKSSDIAIVKNILENNARLWKIKHLIQITPITYPNGFPDDADGTFLKQNGELIVAKKIVPLKSRLDESEKFEINLKKLDGDTLRKQSRLKWLNGW